MAEPIYVPALPARENAWTAYRRLAPHVRDATAPLWTVPDPGAAPGRRRALRDDLHDLVRAQGGRPAWVDARRHESGNDPEPAAAVLRDVLPGTRLRPVTGADRSARQQAACVEIARESGDGLAIRIARTEPPEGRSLTRVHQLIDRIERAGLPLDLLLDAGPVLDDDPCAEKWALTRLARLGPLHPWRTVAVLAGSCPGIEGVPDDYGAPFAEAHRYDWDLWHVLTRSPDGQRVPLAYGDYGAAHPRGVTGQPVIPGGPDWGLLRLTGQRTFLLGKVPTRGDGHAAAVRAMARELADTPDFDEAPDSEGKDWLRACAEGKGSAGVGRPRRWAEAAHSQHLAFVVHQLRRRAWLDWVV